MAPADPHYLIVLIMSYIAIINIVCENINCHRQTNCGPCIASQPCQLSCIGEVCKGSDKIIVCNDNPICDIICDGQNNGQACVDSTIYIDEAVFNATLNCVGIEDCKSTVLYASANHLVINCMNAQNCQDMTVNAALSGSVLIKCGSKLSCEHLHIICGTGDCIIHCSSNQGNVCEGLHLVCGYGHCHIDCTGYNAYDNCPSITVDTSAALSFICIGSISDCRFAPDSFIISTSSPMYETTIAPTTTPAPTTTSAPTTTAAPITDPPTQPDMVFITESTMIPTTEFKEGKVIEITMDIIEQMGDDMDEKQKGIYMDSYTYAMIGVIVTICFIAVTSAITAYKTVRCRGCCNKYFEVDNQVNESCDIKLDKQSSCEISHEFDEGVVWSTDANNNQFNYDKHYSLDGIENKTIQDDDAIVYDIDNMTTTRRTDFDLDRTIIDLDLN